MSSRRSRLTSTGLAYFEQADGDRSMVDGTIPSAIELDEAAFVLNEANKVEVYFGVNVGRLGRDGEGQSISEEGRGGGAKERTAL